MSWSRVSAPSVSSRVNRIYPVIDAEGVDFQYLVASDAPWYVVTGGTALVVSAITENRP